MCDLKVVISKVPGDWPHYIEMQGSTEVLIEVVGRRLLEDQLVQANEHVVIMGSMPIESRERTNFVKLRYVENDR